VQRRYRHVFDAIDEKIGVEDMAYFKKRTVFFALLIAMYDRKYGAESSLSRKSPANISAATFKKIVDAAKRIASGRAPKKVMDATTRRTTHATERRDIVNYLMQNSGSLNDCACVDHFHRD